MLFIAFRTAVNYNICYVLNDSVCLQRKSIKSVKYGKTVGSGILQRCFLVWLMHLILCKVLISLEENGAIRTGYEGAETKKFIFIKCASFWSWLAFILAYVKHANRGHARKSFGREGYRESVLNWFQFLTGLYWKYGRAPGQVLIIISLLLSLLFLWKVALK